MISDLTYPIDIRKSGDCWALSFTAMASPCEILVECRSESDAQILADIAFSETARIEQKYSRYLNGNIVYQINHSGGVPVPIDEETFRLLNFAADCYQLSDGLFDITAGVLRKAWKFDSQEVSPDRELISSLLGLVGFEKMRIERNRITLRPDMEIDFGGLGKEYAVDRVAEILFDKTHLPLMVNFGGDIRALSPLTEREPWVIGIENPDPDNAPLGEIKLTQGGVATSGFSYRYCVVEGKRLGHILNPKTGWPVEDAPRSVTVVADRCTEAGILSTLAMLHGSDAESFLKEQKVKFYCIR